MYKLYFFLLCAMLCTSCSKKYKIEGTSSVSMLDGKMLFIKIPVGDKLVNIDSAEVIHGLFEMQGKVDSTVLASLYMDDECIMPLVIEPGHIDRAYEVEREESRMIMDGKDLQTVHQEIQKKRDEIATEMNQLAKTFIQDNYENVLGPGLFIMLGNSMPYPFMTPLMQEIVDAAPEAFKNNYMVKEYVSVARENMSHAPLH